MSAASRTSAAALKASCDGNPVAVQLPVGNGNTGNGGFGWPKLIHIENANDTASPNSAPCNEQWTNKKLVFAWFKKNIDVSTRWLALGTNMPNVNRPNSGPPTMPNIVRAACSKPPSVWATTNQHIHRHINSYSIDVNCKSNSIYANFC